MAIWWCVPVLAGIALMPDGALDASQTASQTVAVATQHPVCMLRAEACGPAQSDPCMRQRTGR